MRYALVCILILLSVTIHAQTTPEAGDPPVTALISISAADADGIVTISGAAGAVFPAAQVAVKNLYTGETVYVNAGITGSFEARLFGPGSTPFWISPAAAIPLDFRDEPGIPPGGPGTIIYGSPPEARTVETPATPILLDAALDDWDAPLSDSVYALRNRESLYFALADPVPDDGLVSLVYTLNTITYALTFDPTDPQDATLRQIAPRETDPDTIELVLVRAGDTLEARIPFFADADSTLTLEQLTVEDDDGDLIEEQIIATAIPFRDELNGIVYPGGRLSGDFTRFSVSGENWHASGRIDTLTPGETFTLELDVTLAQPDEPLPLNDLNLRAALDLIPVAIDSDNDGTAEQPVAARYTNNGWSNIRADSGLALDNLAGDFIVNAFTLDTPRLVPTGDNIVVGVRFDVTLRADLPPGIYVPVVNLDSPLTAGDDKRLPLVLTVGETSETRLPWTLFYDHPSDGSRGILAEEDTDIIALSNRVRFNSPTYILPPGSYPLEPYLPNFMPNLYDRTGAPLIPLLFPGGRLNVQVTRPDGEVDSLPSAAIVQNRLSTPALDERERFGALTQVDVYRLTTLNETITAYAFDAYGEYVIEMTGSVEDIYGNRYTGGGTYRVVIAEPLDLTPGVLPGTPFEVGDTLYTGAQVAPQFPAEIGVTTRIIPVDGSDSITANFDGTANVYGHFNPDEHLEIDTPGEYIIDYEARHTDSEGRLWAASLRGAGVIATPGTALITRGERGVVDGGENPRAWYNTAPDFETPPRIHAPYHSGDVAIIPDNAESGVFPAFYVQDTAGNYADWLTGTVGGAYRNTLFTQLDAQGRLPLIQVLGGPQTPYSAALLPDFVVNEAYAYVSAVRPGVTVRQYVQGEAQGALPLGWTPNDPYNQQIGAGAEGDLPGDYIFVFGGSVVHNPEAGLDDTAIYASFVAVEDADSPPRVFPPYRGAAGGPDGGALLPGRDLFFLPTAFDPGEVFTEGDTLRLAGQVAPTLTTEVTTTLTAPDGTETTLTGLTNSIGYLYDPANDITLDQSGIWMVEIVTTPAGTSSAGTPEPPLPQGSDTFMIFVVPADAPRLTTERGTAVEESRSPRSPLNFSVDFPEDWTDVNVRYTLTTPAYLLESDDLALLGSSAPYQFNQPVLARDFPNIEVSDAGLAGSDVFTLTFVATGRDENGEPAIRTRTFTLFNNLLISTGD